MSSVLSVLFDEKNKETALNDGPKIRYATICFLVTFFKFEHHECEHVATKCGTFWAYFDTP